MALIRRRCVHTAAYRCVQKAIEETNTAHYTSTPTNPNVQMMLQYNSTVIPISSRTSCYCHAFRLLPELLFVILNHYGTLPGYPVTTCLTGTF